MLEIRKNFSIFVVLLVISSCVCVKREIYREIEREEKGRERELSVVKHIHKKVK